MTVETNEHSLNNITRDSTNVGTSKSFEVEDSLLQLTDHVDIETKRNEGDTSLFCSQRWIVAYMGILAGGVLYLQRVNMSVAIVSMAGSSSNTTADFNNESKTFIYNVSDDWQSLEHSSNGRQPAELDWDKTQQALVLSSFFYGYIVTQIPGGWIAARYGGKRVVGGAIGVTSILTLLVPVCARTHVYLVIANRVIMGIFMGAVCPAWFGLLGVWALSHERSRFLALFLFGTVVGAAVGYSSAGYLCVVGFDNGWGSVFYIHGIIGIVFTVCWTLLVFDSPEKHPRIQDREKNRLNKMLQHTEDKHAIPWVHILTSLPVWSIFIAHLADCWTVYLLMTCLPLFFNDVLNFDIQSNGVYSSLPFLVMGVGLVIGSSLADCIRSRNCLSITSTRKVFQIIGNTLAAAFLVVTGYISTERRELVILCVCLCTFSVAIENSAGFNCNPVDLAPRFASVIFGISNTLGSVPGFLSPIVVTELTQNSTQEEWRYVFYLTAGITGIATVLYGLGASGELAPWSGQEPVELIVEECCKEAILPESIRVYTDGSHQKD